MSVSDSGKCSFERTVADNKSPYKLTFSGIDTSGEHYPSKTIGGADLSAGPFYVASHEVIIFVPLTEIDRTNGTMGDGIGSMRIFNQVTGFDPLGLSGASNYGDGFEPGYCANRLPGGKFNDCAEMEDGSRSNNVTGPLAFGMSPGSWSKSFLDHLTAWSHTLTSLPGTSSSHDGAALIQPGEVHQAQVLLTNGGMPWTEIGLCDVFDNTTLKIAPLNQQTGMTPANASQFADDMYAYVHDSSLPGRKTGQEPNQANYTIEYGSFDLGDDTANNGKFDIDTNRYGGSWVNQANVRCDDNATDWKATPAEVTGGVDKVNAIRAVAKKPEAVAPGSSLYLFSAFEQRDTFSGGPNDGKSIPEGTVAANFGQVSTDTINPGWSLKPTNGSSNDRYRPQPESARTDGDRWTLVRAAARLEQRTILVDGLGSGAADYGNTGNALGGDPVIWETVATMSANSETPGPVKNVIITQTLPKYVTYNAEMTARLTGGTPATTVKINADGTTTLTWLMGDLIPNAPIPSRIVYTETDSLAPAGTALVSHAEITANAMIPVTVHKDDHSVVLEQSGKLQLQKSVDQTLDLQNDTQKYTLKVKNFSANLPIEPVTVIEVLPFNGDATNDVGVNRTPASNFAGTTGITGPVTATDFGGKNPIGGATYYTAIAPNQVPQSLNDDTDPSMWFTESDFGKPGAPANWSDVTAFKFVASDVLATESDAQKSGMVLTFETEQHDNVAGDLYANRFTAFSDTFSNAQTGFQLLTSNQTTVRVVGFSLGDLVWIDQDRDGKFDGGTDDVAPEGVAIDVYDARDNLVGTTKTNAEGRWKLNDLAEGDYYAVIPAAEFAKGGLLNGYAASSTNQVTDANTDLNEDQDHHSVSHGKGVRSSGVVTLSATVDGSKITGDEPLGDNVGGLQVSPLTTDDFTNLTLDLALEPVPGYEFTKTSDPATGTAVNPGDTITYTLTGTNTGKSVLDPVTITDDLSQVLDNATLTAGPAVTVDGAPAAADAVLNGTTLSWSGSLQSDQRVVVTYSLTVNDDAGGEMLKNRASSAATPPGLPPITPPTATTEHPTPGYSFTKMSNPASGTAVTSGSTISYTLTGSNTGQTDLDVTVADDLAGVLAHATMTAAPSVEVAGMPASTDAKLSGTNLSWAGKLAAGETVTITYTVTVNAGVAGVLIQNTASSEATPPGLPPIVPPSVTTEHPTPGFALAKSSDPASGTAVAPDSTITYTVTGTNTGKTALDPVVVTDDLSGVLDHAALTGDAVVTISNEAGDTRDGGAAQLTDTSLVWEGALAVGESVQLVYTVQLNSDAAGVVVNNRASASATPPGLPPIVPPTVETNHPTPGYTFWKSANPASENPVAVGEAIAYTLTGQNNGETVLDPVKITDDLTKVLDHATLEGDITAVITDATGQDRDAEAPRLDGNKLSWSGVLNIGDSVKVSYTVTVNEGAEGSTLTNTASSIATPPGLPPVKPPHVTTEHPVPGYTLAKTSDPGTGAEVKRDETVNFTLTGTNTGATVLDPVIISDNLAAVLNNTSLVGAPVAVIVNTEGVEKQGAAPNLDGTALTWQGVLAVGERVEVTYSVRVNDKAGEVTIENVVLSTATPEGGTVIVPPPVTTTHTTPKPPSSGTNSFGSAKKPGSGTKNPGTGTGATQLSVTGADKGAGVGAASLLLLLAGTALVLRARRKAAPTQ